MHLHIITALRNGADFEVRFLPWSLRQPHLAEGENDVWDDPARDGETAALCASLSVRDHQPSRFLDAHEALFEARHVHGVRLNNFEEVAEVLAKVDVDVDAVSQDLDSRWAHQMLKDGHREMESYGAFGVPTFVVGEDATFVRYMDVPTEDAGASIDLVGSLLDMMAHRPALNEFKHTKIES
jgi:protein-disulfide isomerase-like protein with CxxC motif